MNFDAGKAGSSTLKFGNEVDHVTLGNENNTVSLDSGNDDIDVGFGANTITGGSGQDDIFLAAHSAATIECCSLHGGIRLRVLAAGGHGN